MTLLELVSDYWLILLWVIAIIAVYILRGKAAAFVVFSVGLSLLSYRRGKENQKEKAAAIDRKRENAYNKIDARNTTADDVIERMRDNRY